MYAITGQHNIRYVVSRQYYIVTKHCYIVARQYSVVVKHCYIVTRQYSVVAKHCYIVASQYSVITWQYLFQARSMLLHALNIFTDLLELRPNKMSIIGYILAQLNAK